MLKQPVINLRRLRLAGETLRTLSFRPITNTGGGCPASIGCPPTTRCQPTQANCSVICPTPDTGGGGGGGVDTGTGPTHSGTAPTDCACTVQTL